MIIKPGDGVGNVQPFTVLMKEYLEGGGNNDIQKVS